MKKTILTSCAFIVLAILPFSCGNSNSKETLSSKEDNTSEGVESSSSEVSIGKQVWMTKNLDVTHFRNGDVIPEAKSVGEWKAYADAGEAAWCYVNNESIWGGHTASCIIGMQ